MDLPKKYNIYVDQHQVKHYLVKNKSLSCIYKKYGTFVFVLNNKKEIKFEIGTMDGKYNHLYYYTMKLDRNTILDDFGHNQIESHCMLLPKLEVNGLPSENIVLTTSIYTIIRDDWKALDENKLLK